MMFFLVPIFQFFYSEHELGSYKEKDVEIKKEIIRVIAYFQELG